MPLPERLTTTISTKGQVILPKAIRQQLPGDHPHQSVRARALIDGQEVFVAITVMLEVEWVLRSTYG